MNAFHLDVKISAVALADHRISPAFSTVGFLASRVSQLAKRAALNTASLRKITSPRELNTQVGYSVNVRKLGARNDSDISRIYYRPTHGDVGNKNLFSEYNH